MLIKKEIRETFEDKTVLVTGGAGAVGSNLVKTLNTLKTKKIVVLDDLSSSYEWVLSKRPKINFVQGSVLDGEKLKEAFKEKPDIVYHLAAYFTSQNSVDDPERDLMVNGMGTLRVLEHARIARVERFIYASSGNGVCSETKIPSNEHSFSMKIHTPYQVTKMLGELYSNYYYNLYHLPVVNSRLFGSYGPGEVPGKYRGIIPNFLWLSMNKQPLPIIGTGEEMRNFTYVSDIVNGLLAMACYRTAIGETFNLAANREVRIVDVAEYIVKLTNNSAGIVVREKQELATNTHFLVSTEKAERLLSYQPTVDFKEGLKHAYEWLEENEANIRTILGLTSYPTVGLIQERIPIFAES